MQRITPNYLSAEEKRQAAIDLISRLVEEAMENGQIPQPSKMGIVGQDDEDEDPVYDWCQAIIEELQESEVTE